MRTSKHTKVVTTDGLDGRKKQAVVDGGVEQAWRDRELTVWGDEGTQVLSGARMISQQSHRRTSVAGGGQLKPQMVRLSQPHIEEIDGQSLQNTDAGLGTLVCFCSIDDQNPSTWLSLFSPGSEPRMQTKKKGLRRFKSPKHSRHNGAHRQIPCVLQARYDRSPSFLFPSRKWNSHR